MSIILSFVAAFFSAISFYNYLKSTSEADKANWFRLGKIGFIAHGLATLLLISLTFYVMINAMYEYNYVHGHVSDDLPMRFIFSAFWEGQEGSFMLWMFWHVILGFIFLRKTGRWSASVVMTLGLIEMFLASMLLGLHIPLFGDDFKIGSNPTLLLRDVVDAPIFSKADYLSLIEGKGMNPLLQNYWMTIHPPVLFLGFASTALPFGFALGGLITKDHTGWLRPALRWSLFSAFFLGTGILMGAAWAYEALGFGGYWAWDPVENASFVPWIILIAGVHTNLIGLSTGYSIRTTYIFYLLSFVLIIYSTFLTRSGILGDTSAHSFTQMGLEWQLTVFVSFFFLLGLFAYLYRRKSIPTKEKEESLNSREFWMLIGSIVLFFSAALITTSTSLPVFNTIMDATIEPGYIGRVIEDPIEHYNKYQLWIAVLIGFLSGATQYLRYGARNWDSFKKKFFTHLGAAILLSIAGAFFIGSFLNNAHWQHYVLVFSGLFAVISNLDYLITFIKGNLKASASVISHLGFGLLIFGILFSGLNKDYLTSDPFGQQGILVQEQLKSNLALFQNVPYPANSYWFTYTGDTLEGNLKKFNINFKKTDGESQVLEEFNLKPSAIYDAKFTNIGAFNPDTKHYWNKDIFTSVTGYPSHLQNIDSLKIMEDTMVFNPYTIQYRDTFHLTNKVKLRSGFRMDTIIGHFDEYTFSPVHENIDLDSVDLAVGATISFKHPIIDSIYTVTPALVLTEGLVYQYPVTIDPLRLRVGLNESVFEQVFTQENELVYENILLRKNESTSFKGYTIGLAGFDNTPTNNKYRPEEDDIALAAELTIRKEGDRRAYDSNPIIIIRGNQQFSIKDYIPDLGLHVRFNKIDPKTEQMTFSLASEERNLSSVKVNIAENVPRSDILVIESIIFPGINLVWLGTCMMLFGLLLGMIVRSKN